MLGRLSKIPIWEAKPNPRGWAIPWPSKIMRSGAYLTFSKAASNAGPSLKVKSPGTYGKSILLDAYLFSSIVKSGKE